MSIKKMIALCLIAGTVGSAVPAAAQESAGERVLIPPFVDIKNHPSRTAIINGYQYGLFAGSGKSGRFEPDRLMTRAEFLTLLDRVFLQNEQQLYPLLLLSEHDEIGLGEGFDEPYLPYTDVDRMTWMYQPILRFSIAFDKMFGPGALESVFPAPVFSPDRPITREEASRLLALFNVAEGASDPTAENPAFQWKDQRKSGPLKRGDAAVLAMQVTDYLHNVPILPLLDPAESIFPVVPEITDVFPLFAVFTDKVNEDEAAYLRAVDEIQNFQENEESFALLRKLADNGFYLQLGVHYYLSWDPYVSLEENLQEAFLAIDAYFADKVIRPKTLQLLVANVYDLSLKLEADNPRIYQEVLSRLSAYEKRIKPESEEWKALAIYQGAMEAKQGNLVAAIQTYSRFLDREEALRNAVYYLVATDQLPQARELLDSIGKEEKQQNPRLLAALAGELTLLQKQNQIIGDLSFALRRTEQFANFQIDGESMLNGFAFKYKQWIDNDQRISRAEGYYQSPNGLVLNKLQSYFDERGDLEYLYDQDEKQWVKYSKQPPSFMHEWVNGLSVRERASRLHARYHKQTYGTIDVITEWVPSKGLREHADDVRLSSGKIKNAPVFVNKYYIDRNTNLLVRHVWRYEEIYEREYAAYQGSDWYRNYGNSSVFMPAQIKEKAVESK